MYRILKCCINGCTGVRQFGFSGIALEQRRQMSDIKMTKTLRKMFDRGAFKTKKKYYPSTFIKAETEKGNFEQKKKQPYSDGQKRRAHQVGRILYDNIVQLINSGQLSPELAALSVEIVFVKVIPDFSSMNVYWMATGSEQDENIQILLKKHEGILRDRLTSYHVLGKIPHVNFVRDDSRAHSMLVEKLLRNADFGPDFVPTVLTSSMQETISLQRLDKDPSANNNLQKNFDLINHAKRSDFEGTNSQHLQGQSLGSSPLSGTGAENMIPAYSNTSFSEQNFEKSVIDRSEQFVIDKQEKRVIETCTTDVTDCQETSDTNQVSFVDSISLGSSSATGVENSHEIAKLSFRDNLYGVNRSELIQKIVLRKKQRKIQSVSTSVEVKSNSNIQTVMNKNNLKALIKKRVKPSRAHSSASDYELGGIEYEPSNSGHGEMAEIEYESDSRSSDYEQNDYSVNEKSL